MFTANITEVIEESPGQYIVTAVVNDGVKDTTRVFKGIVSKEGAESAVRSYVNSLQLTPPTPGVVKLVEDPIPEPTPEESKLQAIYAKEAELEEEIRRVEAEKKRAEIASQDPVVASKLAELESLKSEK